jgi:hypothetical protein
MKKIGDETGRAPEEMLLAWTMEEQRRYRRAHPTYYETDNWLFHLGVSEERIQRLNEEVAKEELAQFLREFATLTESNQDRFITAMKRMVPDARAGKPFALDLRVKGVRSHPGILELTWADDGHGAFEYGSEQISGEKHIIWRRIGGHDIFKNP